MKNKFVLLTGAARSGTTIIGKFLSTHENQEYAFEPQVLFHLYSSAFLGQISYDVLNQLLEAYIFDEFLPESLAGRRINTNMHDDSSVYNYMDVEEIEQRLSQSWTRDNPRLMKKFNSSQVILKMTDILYAYSNDWAPSIKSGKIYSTLRNPFLTIRSLSRKDWFSDAGIESGRIFPVLTTPDGRKAPVWAIKNSDEFLSLTDIDRCAYYVSIMMEKARNFPSQNIICYELFVSSAAYRESLSSKLKLIRSRRTDYLEKELHSGSLPNDSLVDQISSSLSSKMLSQISSLNCYWKSLFDEGLESLG